MKVWTFEPTSVHITLYPGSGNHHTTLYSRLWIGLFQSPHVAEIMQYLSFSELCTKLHTTAIQWLIIIQFKVNNHNSIKRPQRWSKICVESIVGTSEKETVNDSKDKTPLDVLFYNILTICVNILFMANIQTVFTLQIGIRLPSIIN